MTLGHPFCVFIAFLIFPFLGFSQFEWSNQTEKLYRSIVKGEKVSVDLKSESQGYTPYLQALQEVVNHFVRSENQASVEYVEQKLEECEVYEDESNEYKFCLGEIHFYLGLIHVSLDNKIKGLVHLKKAYNLHDEILLQSPNFIPSYKTRGVLKIVFGEAQYYLSLSKFLTGVDTKPKEGMMELQKVINTSELFREESQLLKTIILQFVCFEYKKASEMANLLFEKDNPISLVVAGIVFHKNNNANKSNECLRSCGIQNPYIDFLIGVNFTYLNKIDQANYYFDRFQRRNWTAFKYSTYYYKAVLYYLNNKRTECDIAQNQMQKVDLVMPLDKKLSKKVLPSAENSYQLRARLYFDAGEWQPVKNELELYARNHDKSIEYYYLLAKTHWYEGDLVNAKKQFLNVVKFQNKGQYYQPYSCFYLAKISLMNDEESTSHWIERGFRYKKYPHQQMIEVQLKKLKDEVTK